MDIARRCFRVDANLRPEGRDGPLVRSVDATRRTGTGGPSRGSSRRCSRPCRSPAIADLGREWASAAAPRCGAGGSAPTTCARCGRIKARAEAEVAAQGPGRPRGQAGAGRHPRHRVRGAAAPARARPVDPELRSPTTLVALAELARAATSPPTTPRAWPAPTASCAGSSTASSSWTSSRSTRCPPTETSADASPGCSATGAAPRPDRPRRSTASWPASATCPVDPRAHLLPAAARGARRGRRHVAGGRGRGAGRLRLHRRRADPGRGARS